MTRLTRSSVRRECTSSAELCMRQGWGQQKPVMQQKARLELEDCDCMTSSLAARLT